MWSASAWVATIILQPLRLKSISADQVDDFINGVFKADVHKKEFVAVFDEIDVYAKPASRLVVQFDNVREINILACVMMPYSSV